MGKSTDKAAATQREWSVTQTALDRLLQWLDADRDRAAEKYEHVRRCLIRIFISRGYTEADDLADRTIDRVAQLNLEQNIAATYVGSPVAYFARAARYIRQEYDRRKLDPRQLPQPESSEQIEQEHACLEECLQQIAAEDRELVLDYYRDDKRAKIERRRGLAERLGVSSTALRLKVHRLRLSLQQCMGECLARQGLG